MSLDTFKKANTNLRTAEEARTRMLRSLLGFQAACLSGEWDKTERFRQEAKDHLDAYLDNLAVAHRGLRRI